MHPFLPGHFALITGRPPHLNQPSSRRRLCAVPCVRLDTIPVPLATSGTPCRLVSRPLSSHSFMFGSPCALIIRTLPLPQLAVGSLMPESMYENYLYKMHLGLRKRALRRKAEKGK